MKNTLRGVNTFADPSFHQQNNALKEREWRVFFPIKFPRHGIYDVSAKICQRRAPNYIINAFHVHRRRRRRPVDTAEYVIFFITAANPNGRRSGQ
jgi:hypothetical protein